MRMSNFDKVISSYERDIIVERADIFCFIGSKRAARLEVITLKQ